MSTPRACLHAIPRDVDVQELLDEGSHMVSRQMRQSEPARLSLVVIRALDLDAMTRFYSILGVHFETERHGKGPRHLVGHLGDVTFEIYPRGQGEPLRRRDSAFYAPP
jgi:hypothetical protein